MPKKSPTVPKMIPNPEYTESAAFQARLESFKDTLINMGECVEDYFPGEYGKEIPEVGGWIMLLMSVHVGKMVGDVAKSIVVPHLSIWYATPSTTQMGRKIDGVDIRMKQAIIRTLDGDVHVWPHEYTTVDLSKYLEFTEEDGFYIRFLHPETGGFDEKKLHYIRSRGISEAQAKRWLLPQLNNPNFCYFEFDPEIAGTFREGTGTPYARFGQRAIRERSEQYV